MYRITLEHVAEDETVKILLAEHELSVDVAIAVLSSIISATPKAEPERDEAPVETEEVPTPRPGKSTKGVGQVHRRRGEPCAECGSKGTRHFKTCMRAMSAPISSPVPKPVRKDEPMTETQFDVLKATQEEGDMISSEYAREHDLPLREVNVAIFSEDYESYLEERKSA